MPFNIRVGVPGMEATWNDLVARARCGKSDREETKSYRKLTKALAYLRENPRHNSLASHEIDALSRKCGFRVFQSYFENRNTRRGPSVLGLWSGQRRHYDTCGGTTS